MISRRGNATTTSASSSSNSMMLPLTTQQQSPSTSTKKSRRRKAPRRRRRSTSRWKPQRLVSAFIAAFVILLCLCHVLFQIRRNSTDTQAIQSSLNNSTSASERLVISNNTTTSTKEQQQQPFVKVSPLVSPIDYEKYTVRINTWKREEHLQLSIQHHATCDSVHQIQVVWCVDQGPVPAWLVQLEEETAQFVVVERHAVNSLNERFWVPLSSSSIQTAAVLSIDDDVIRPCLALDAAFDKWTRNPDRQVGFDARSHTTTTTIVSHNNNNNKERWKYAYMSTTEKANAYSITLTRCCFLHRDYLTTAYWQVLPATIRETVAANFNCEDIAMSLLISSLTNSNNAHHHQPPLLADLWAVKSQVKLYVGDSKISGGKDHKGLRDDCINDFAELLHLKEQPQPLVPAKLYHGTHFEYGAPADNWNPIPDDCRLGDDNAINQANRVVARWKQEGYDTMVKELGELRMQASRHIYEKGLIENTEPWKDRFQQHHRNNK